jgi:hypothetical protein
MSFGAQFNLFQAETHLGLKDGDAYSGCRRHRSAGLCAMKVVL